MRAPVDQHVDWFGQIGANGRFFREGAFNDQSVVMQTGPQFVSGSNRISVLAMLSWRWFGGEHYASSYGLSGEYRHPLDSKTELRLEGSGTHINDKLNALRSVDRLSLAAGVDTAFTAGTGGGAHISATREIANDPAYSTASLGGDVYIFKEFASTTAVLRAAFSHREADARLFLYPERRTDDRIELSVAGTFRALRVGSFAPLARVRYEQNCSTVDIYDYRRLSAEIGITGAF